MEFRTSTYSGTGDEQGGGNCVQVATTGGINGS